MQGSGADTPTGTLQLQLPNRRDALEPARRAVLAFVARFELSPRAVYRLELVLEEVLMNLVTHAFPDTAAHTIGLRLGADGGDLVLEFEDDGRPFDPLQAAAPAAPASLAEAVPGGLGLPLLRKACREMHYERVDGRNRLRLRIARQ